jgi:predicted AlkP superfamily phosphohydrolase/phosphomutase
MSKARVSVVSFDAADHRLIHAFTRSGDMPVLRRLFRESARLSTLAPEGVFVSANWPTLFTATLPDRHHYLCWEEIPGGTYGHAETDPTRVHGTPIWERLSEAGKRVAVLDVPHTIVRPVNGVMISEWGCHDRHLGTTSWPPDLVLELSGRHGQHFCAMDHPPEREQFAPCDYTYRDGHERTADEEVALFGAICDSLERKRALWLELLDRGGWDFFLNVMGESHCVGHQLWHAHDPAHPKHDPELVRRMGGDPIREVYRRLDAALGDHLARLTPSDTVYVLFAHGMAAHHDGTHLFDHMLHRLDWSLDAPGGFGTGTRAAAELSRFLPAPLRRPALRAGAPLLRTYTHPPDPEPLPPLHQRRWFMTPNNTVVGAVRLNLAGREPAGRIHPDDRREVLEWLSKRLLELVNVESGGRVVRRCVITDDIYRRTPGDALADLYVEWERSHPIERVWSPAVGTVAIPYDHWRQGDHVREGFMFASGPGIRPGKRREVADVVDLGATFCAALGVDLDDVDGKPVESVLPGEATRPRRRRGIAALGRARIERTLQRHAQGRVPGWAGRQDPALLRLREETHATASAIDASAHMAHEELATLKGQVGRLDRQGDIAAMSAWLSQADVAEDLLISVVLPTRDRRDLLAAAIESVEAQSYSRWELLVVDDGSADGTADYLAAIDDPRVRLLEAGGVGPCGARNVALEVATGHVIAYLDDDNRFDPHWLKAVAITFAAHPDATVCYGARVLQDEGSVLRGTPSHRPGFHFVGWDEQAIRDYNIADTNVLAHRRSDVRFDEDLAYFGDWDLLLRLAADSEPVEVPAIATYYRTDADGRMSDALEPEEIDREYNLVRGKLADDDAAPV